MMMSKTHGHGSASGKIGLQAACTKAEVDCPAGASYSHTSLMDDYCYGLMDHHSFNTTQVSQMLREWWRPFCVRGIYFQPFEKRGCARHMSAGQCVILLADMSSSEFPLLSQTGGTY